MMKLSYLIRSLGISGTHLGYYYLETALGLVLEDRSRLLMISKSLYPEVARRHGTTISCVERDIRTAVTICWARGDRERLHQMAGYRLPSKPTNGQFLDILALYLQEQEELAKSG